MAIDPHDLSETEHCSNTITIDFEYYCQYSFGTMSVQILLVDNPKTITGSDWITLTSGAETYDTCDLQGNDAKLFASGCLTKSITNPVSIMPTDEVLDVTVSQLLSMATGTDNPASQITYNSGPSGTIYTDLEDICYCVEDSAGEYVCGNTFDVILFCKEEDYLVHDFGES